MAWRFDRLVERDASVTSLEERLLGEQVDVLAVIRNGATPL